MVALTGNRGRSWFDTIVSDYIELLKHFDDVVVVLAYTFANSVAHLLARIAHLMSCLQEWLYTSPDFIECTVAT